MKIIVTEEQYNKIFNQTSMFWIKRRFNSVKKALKETFELMEFDICRIDNYDKFENKFFSVLMDCLHPEFYEDDGFDYEGLQSILMDMFYVECTEFYSSEREKC